jgi:hypothetical protein
MVDDILRRELQAPGFDRRCGVNLICRPPREIIHCVGGIQACLAAVEPDQYYYPAGDLHLTLFEISHGEPLEDVEKDARKLITCVSELL